MSTRRAVLESTDFEPYDNRHRRNPTGRIDSLVNLVKGILGTGMLAMPEAFKHAGLIMGTVGTILITALVTYCLHLLGMYFFCKRDQVSQITYPQAFKEALLLNHVSRKFANAAPYVYTGCPSVRYFVNFFIIVYQLGIMAVYIAFCATNIKQVVDHYKDKENHYGTEIYDIILLIPFLLISFVKDMKHLAPFSQVANWVTLVAVAAIHYYYFENMQPIGDRSLFGHVTTYPLFMGTTMFSVLAIGAILSIELNMKNGRQWGGNFGVLNLGMGIVTVLNIFTGFFGYWRYGEEVKSVVTLNINISQVLAQVIRILFCAAIYVSYALQSYPAYEILWEQYTEMYMQTSQHILLWEYSIRTILVLISFLMAIYVPNLGMIISLFGAFCLSVLGIIIPPILDLCIRWPDDLGPYTLYLYVDIFLIIFGVFGFLFGTYDAIGGMFEEKEF